MRYLSKSVVAAMLLAGVLVGVGAGAATVDVKRPKGVAGQLIEHFKMQPVPDEGPWFALNYVSDDKIDGSGLPTRYSGRAHAAGSAIVAVVTGRDFSAMHRLKTDEGWHFYGGSPLRLLLLYPDGHGATLTLGANVLAGQLPQIVVPQGVWMGAIPGGKGAERYSFIGNQLGPGFDYADFEIGYRDELQRQYPAFANQITALTRAQFSTRPKRGPTPTPVAAAQGAAFTDQQVSAVTASPGVTLRELVGRTAVHGKSTAVSVAKFTLAPGQSTGVSQNLRSEEVFLVTDGTGVVHLGDKVAPVNVDSTVFIPAGQLHSIEADQLSTLTFYAVSAPAFSPQDYVAVKP